VTEASTLAGPPSVLAPTIAHAPARSQLQQPPASSPSTASTFQHERAPGGFIGVRQVGTSRWQVRVFDPALRKMRAFGVFTDAVAAAMQYDSVSLQLRGARARLNFATGEDGKPDPSRPAQRPKPTEGAQRFTSRYLGVYYVVGKRAWRARIVHGGKRHSLGTFPKEDDAAAAYDAAAVEMRGAGAVLNFHRCADGQPDKGRPTGARVNGRPRRGALLLPPVPATGATQDAAVAACYGGAAPLAAAPAASTGRHATGCLAAGAPLL